MKIVAIILFHISFLIAGFYLIRQGDVGIFILLVTLYYGIMALFFTVKNR